MHGDQRVIELRIECADAGIIDGDPFAEQRFEPSDAVIRKTQLEPEDDTHAGTDDRPEYPRNQELSGYDLMILAEDIMRDKIGLKLIPVVMFMKMIIKSLFTDQNISLLLL